MSRNLDAIRLTVVMGTPTPDPEPSVFGEDFYFKNGKYWRSDGERACNNHDGGWWCTLPQEHEGPHIAEDGRKDEKGAPPTWE